MRYYFELLIFDLDGTIADTGIDITNSVNYIRSIHGLSPLEYRDVIKLIGNGLKNTLQKSLAEKKDEIENAIKLFIKHYGEHLLDNTVLYPGIKEILEYYKNKKKAVISNKVEIYCKKILEGLGVQEYFNLVMGRDSVPVPKPDPSAIIETIKRLDIDKSRAIMIGDGVNDIVSAKKAGIKSCAVGYGYGDKEELLSCKPDYFIEKIEELRDVV